MGRGLGRLLYIFNEREGMGFGDVVFEKKCAGLWKMNEGKGKKVG